MKVTIDKSIFEQYGSNCVPSDRFHDFLMNMETQKSYVLCTDPAIRPEDVQSKLNQLDNLILGGVLSRSINLPVEQHFSDCVVVVGGEHEDIDKRFSLNEINEYLHTAATIVVENGKNDGCFVRAIMKYFTPLINFEEQLSNRSVDIDPAGGSGAKSRIEYFLDIHHNQPKYLRHLVIVDGDKRFPGDNTYESYRTQQNDDEYFQSKTVFYHILEKRTMENYMPDEVYSSQRNVFGDSWVDAYLRLTEEQKDYYYIAVGFLKDVPKNVRKDTNLNKDRTQLQPVAIQDLYSTVSDGDYQVLLNKPDIGGTFKNEFPRYYNDSQVTMDSLLRRSPRKPTGKSELEEIAEKIKQLL